MASESKVTSSIPCTGKELEVSTVTSGDTFSNMTLLSGGAQA